MTLTYSLSFPFQGPLPKPSLQAQPSSLVPLGQSVTLRCQGPPDVDLYRLEKLKPEKYEDQDFLVIPTMETNNAGLYRCSYQNGSRWSLPSDQLELIATGNWTGEGRSTVDLVASGLSGLQFCLDLRSMKVGAWWVIDSNS